MNIKVMYHTMTGNTEKVAKAMAEALGVTAEKIDERNIAEPIDMLFIGDGVYAGKPDTSTVNFIKSLNDSTVKNAAVFGTYGGQKKAVEIMKELLKEQGIKVSAESFGCKGKCWSIINRRHPSEEELSAAKEYAKSIVKEL
jgi:flavorubredoxin